jgi:hypothetical protein
MLKLMDHVFTFHFPEDIDHHLAFGRGIYFADMMQKSAPYCHGSYDSSDAFLLLCEGMCNSFGATF